MSNVIPPLLSSSPPPMVGMLDEEEDDEFGDFAVATNLSYGCDALSLPSSPQKSPLKTTTQSIPNHCHEVDTNNSETTTTDAFAGVEKDYQDKRKTDEVSNYDGDIIKSTSESSVGQEKHIDASVNSLLCNNSKIQCNTDSKYSTFQYFPEIPPDLVPENEEDEFDDAGDDFDNFQDFESSTAIETDISKFVISDEIDSATECADEESRNIETVEQALNNFKPNGKGLLVADDCIKCDSVNGEASTTCDQSEIVIDHSVTSVSNHVALNYKENLEEPETSLQNVNINSQESKKHDFVDQVPIQVPDEVSTKKDEITFVRDNTNSLKDVIETKNSSINEEGFGDAENLSFKPEVHDKSEPSLQITNLSSDITIIPNKPDLHLNPNESIDNSDDDFGDFETPLPDPTLQWNSDPFNANKSVDIDDDFGDFDNQVFEHNDQGGVSTFPSLVEAQVQSEPRDADEDDDFGDFNDYSIQTQASQSDPEGGAYDAQQLERLSSVDIELIPQKSHTIILEMFPVVEQLTEDYCEEDFTSKDVVFHGLKDVTDTSALLYQWGKSISQNYLLSALNIDTRNILYGPRWNEAMPRYAATLGYTPLEPMKPETLTPTAAEPSAAPSPSSQTPSNEALPQTDIPSAQFDWVGSGLTNPLENSPASTMLLDLEQLVASLDIQFTSTLTPKSRNSPSPVNDIDDWEFWLRLTPKKSIEKRDSQSKQFKNPEQSTVNSEVALEPDVKPSDFEFSSTLQPEVNTTVQTQSDSGSVKSLQLNEILTEEGPSKSEISATHFDDFTSFQSSSKMEQSSWSFNAIPLRETHISNLQTDTFVARPVGGLNSDEPGWLKPTIVTPDLPRKTTEVRHEEEDEFADFQTSEAVANENVMPVKTAVECIKTEVAPEPCVDAALGDVENDDEFTDFQSTLPNFTPSVVQAVPAPQEPLQPSYAILEPLKPSVLNPVVSTSINWPDPGVSDDDLGRFELFYKPKPLSSDSESPALADSNEKSVSVVAQADLAATDCSSSREPPKNVDDDDWSDFVSNQGHPAQSAIPQIQPLFKTTNQIKQPSRTSTPELSLCVPQLNQIQLPRKSVPVITQHGLVQTKLSSYLPIAETAGQPSVQHTRTYPQTSHLQNGIQPSLISSQFAAQLNQGLSYRNTNVNTHQNRAPHNSDLLKQTKQSVQQEFHNHSRPPQLFTHLQSSKPPAMVSSSKLEEFDDEWTDFVSSQPTPPVVPQAVPNGLHEVSIPKLNFDWNRPPQFTSWSANVTPNIITNPVSFDSFQSYASPAQTDLLKNRTSIKRNPNAVVQPKKNAIPSISNVPDLEFIAPKSRTWKK